MYRHTHTPQTESQLQQWMIMGEVIWEGLGRGRVQGQAHPTLWVQEGPAALFKKPLGVIHDRLHDFGPVQRLHSFRVLNITGTEREGEGEGEKERWRVKAFACECVWESERKCGHVISQRWVGGALLQPLLDWVQGVDRHSVDHGDLLAVVLVDDHHVKVL